MVMFIALLTLSSTVIGIALVRAIRQDGLGTRPGPRSHHDDAFAPRTRV